MTANHFDVMPDHLGDAKRFSQPRWLWKRPGAAVRLTLELFIAAFIDGFDYFVGLFEHHRLETLVSLLTVPRTTAGRTQSRDQFDEIAEFFACWFCG
jgi:hypothetical protein